MKPLVRRLLVVTVLLLALSLVVAGTTFAQDETPPPPEATPGPPTPPPPLPPACVADVATGTSCVKIVFYPATLYADLYLVTPPADPAADPNPVETPTEQVQQAALWVTFVNPVAGQTQTVTVKNIKDYGVGDGTWYLYPDMPKTVTAPATLGTTSTVTLYPVKKYIRGLVNLKCNPLAKLATEDVACLVTIDDVPQPDLVAAGVTIGYITDPGPHTFKVDLTGADAALWPPGTLTKAVTVTASAYPQTILATFNKASHLVASITQPTGGGWVGDWYVDGTLAASQVGGIDGWVKGNATHKIEVKNITNPASPLIKPYLDAVKSVYTYSSQTSTVSVTLTKIPATQLVLPRKCGQDNLLTSNTYAAVRFSWLATTYAYAQQNKDVMIVVVGVNGVVADITGYASGPTAEYPAVECPGSTEPPTGYYLVHYVAPLGKLAPGTYTYQFAFAFVADAFDGWDLYPGGNVYLSGEYTFQVSP